MCIRGTMQLFVTQRMKSTMTILYNTIREKVRQKWNYCSRNVICVFYVNGRYNSSIRFVASVTSSQVNLFLYSFTCVRSPSTALSVAELLYSCNERSFALESLVVQRFLHLKHVREIIAMMTPYE